MDWFVKHWDELTREEVYDLLAREMEGANRG